MTTSVERDDALIVALFHDDDAVIWRLQDGAEVRVEGTGLEETARRHAPFDERAILRAIGRRLLPAIRHPGRSGGPAFTAGGGERDLAVRWIDDHRRPEVAGDSHGVQPESEALDAVRLFSPLRACIR